MSRNVRLLTAFVLAAALVPRSTYSQGRAATVPAPVKKPMNSLEPFAKPDPARWKKVEQLANEQKLEAASEEAARLRQEAKRRGESGEWTRALVKEVQLRQALHGYETSVRFLREQPWPDHPLARWILDLFYAHQLASYLRVYSWEINQRERVAATGTVDLKAWTGEQIFQEALRAHGEIWQEREALESHPVNLAEEFLDSGNYPPRIRGTLRDAYTYLAVDLLGDTSFWRPEDSNEVYRLDLRTLLASGKPAVAKLDDPSIHPVTKIAALLDDLETWHRTNHRPEAALEARLERYRRLASAFAQPMDRQAIRDHLANTLDTSRSLEWWSMGQALLAEQVRDQEDDRVQARRLALQGEQAYPRSLGAQACRHIVAALEAPRFELTALSSDGLDKRSIQVQHQNVGVLHFRAYPIDLVRQIQSAKDYGLLPDRKIIERLLRSANPAASWKVELPPTTDYRSHTTYVTPRLPGKGLWVIAASAREDFAGSPNWITAIDFIATGLVLSSRLVAGQSLEINVLDGENGQPVPGTRVSLYQYDFQKGHHPTSEIETGPDGVAVFQKPSNLPGRDDSAAYFVLARKGDDLALDPQFQRFSERARAGQERASLIYTDRSVYRPQQKIFFKVLAYRGQGAKYQVATHEAVTLRLHDANGQVVETRQLQTNAFGSAAGELTIPPGRLLGSWSLRTSLNGHAAVRVEEYKRPTFEMKLEEPAGEARLNRPVTMPGEAHYYFGLPVTSGQIRWKVVRTPVYPWWWSWYAWGTPRDSGRIVASGATALSPDGHFRVVFTPEADERENREVSYRYQVSATLTDEGGETRSADRTIRLGFVAVEAQVAMANAFFLDSEAAELSVTRSSLDGVGRAGKGRYRVVKLQQPAQAFTPAELPLPAPPRAQQPSARIYTMGDKQRPRHQPQYSPEQAMASWSDGEQVAAAPLEHGPQGQARVSLGELAAGAYRFRYQTTDEHGVPFETFKDFIVAGRHTPLALPGVLLVQTATVNVGGTARFLVHSGYINQHLRVELQRGEKQIEKRSLRSGEVSLVEIPVTARDRGGFAVTLALLRDFQPITLQQSVFVPWDDKELAVSFSTFRDSLRPGQKETWRVQVRAKTTQQAEARTAELLAYMYDRSLDVFAPHSPPVPLGVYPTFRRATIERFSLVGRPIVVSFDHDWARIPSGPELRSGSLRGYNGYGGVGPGGGGVGTGLRLRLPPQAAPAPALAGAPQPEGNAERTRSSAALVSKQMDVTSNHLETAGESATGQPPELRSNFAETAFFLPNLVTDDQGTAAIEFTVPDSVTAYSVWVHAVTQDLRSGFAKAEARAVKELMVRPYLPRFLREGDQAELKVVVNNAAQRDLVGNLWLEVFDPETNRSLAGDFGLSSTQSSRFAVKAGGGTNLSFRLKTPKRVGVVAFKVVARAGDLSDGEQRALPLLPSRMHLAQSRFVTLRDRAKRIMTFADLRRNDDPTRVNERLVVTVDAQLFYTVLKALPYLVDYPYECAEQTLNRFVSTGVVAGLYQQYPAIARMAKSFSQRQTRLEAFEAPDPNRRMTLEESPWLEEAKGGAQADEQKLLNLLDPVVAKAQRDSALAKLRKIQTASGGWPWFPGGPPSLYMTAYVLSGLARSIEFGVDVPQDLTQRGWQYLGQTVRETVFTAMSRQECCWETVTLVNYVLSLYPQASWHGDVFSAEERKRMLDFSFARWKRHSPMLEAYLALTLARSGRGADARLVFESVMDSAKTSEDQGTFWAPEERSWLWYNDTIETHALALRTLTELMPKHPKRDGLVLWLLLNKKLNHWKSTRATAEVIYSLAHALKADESLGVREVAKLTVGDDQRTLTFEPDQYVGKTQVVYGPESIDPVKSSTVTVEKETRGLLFASATWHFSTDQLPAEERGDFFSVNRAYFKRETSGKETVLRPISEGIDLEIGDEVEVQLSLRSKHQTEYVHLRDPRGAGFEPQGGVSRYRFDLGIGWYEEYRDSGTNFFFETLPAGEYTFKYRIRASMAGSFRVGPAVVQPLYAPEFVAYSTGQMLTVAR